MPLSAQAQDQEVTTNTLNVRGTLTNSELADDIREVFGGVLDLYATGEVTSSDSELTGHDAIDWLVPLHAESGHSYDVCAVQRPGVDWLQNQPSHVRLPYATGVELPGLDDSPAGVDVASGRPGRLVQTEGLAQG